MNSVTCPRSCKITSEISQGPPSYDEDLRKARMIRQLLLATHVEWT